MTIFNQKAIRIASIPLKAVSFVLTAPIVLVRCLFRFLSSLLKWVNNKIEKLFEHKDGENKFVHIMKDLGSFIVTLPTKILEFACNLINAILDLPQTLISSAARIFETANFNDLHENITYTLNNQSEKFLSKKEKEDMRNAIKTGEMSYIPINEENKEKFKEKFKEKLSFKNGIDNLDFKFNNLMLTEMEKFDKKINPPIVSCYW